MDYDEDDDVDKPKVEQHENNGGLGDDFDDFEEGAVADDDFGDFDDGFQQPEEESEPEQQSLPTQKALPSTESPFVSSTTGCICTTLQYTVQIHDHDELR